MKKNLGGILLLCFALVLSLHLTACGGKKIEGKPSECVAELESLPTNETATVTVTGTAEVVGGVYEADDGSYVVTLTDDGEIDADEYIHCHFHNPSEDTVKKLQSGRRFTITGTIKGDSALLPHNITDCKLE